MARPETWNAGIPEPGRWADGVATLGYVEGDDEYGCTICRRGPAHHFRYLTVHEHSWYVSSGFSGLLCRHCCLGMGRAFQVKTILSGWRVVAALPMALVMLLHNAVTLRAGRATLPEPEPAHAAADAILAGVPVWRRPAFLGAVAFAAAVAVAAAPGVVL